MSESIEGRSRELLEAPNFGFIATQRKDGGPYGAIVWVDLDDDTVVLNSARGRTWPRNLERDGRVALLVENHENPYEYVAIRGRMVEITEEGADAHIDALAKKYLGQDTYPFRAPGERRIIVRIAPEHVTHQG